LLALALTACQLGAGDRTSNASALGADSSRLFKATPTAAGAPGAARAPIPGGPYP
jgi:hypothetical protein